MTGAVRALLLAGGEPPWTDPWHPYAETADRLAAVAQELGWRLERSEDVAGRLAAGLDGVDVLLVDAPAPGPPGVDPEVLAAADAALAAFARRGGGVLALHTAAVTLLGLPRWTALTGARWVDGVSGHPPLGPCTVRGHDPSLPGAFDLVDERYSGLALEGERSVLVSHEDDAGAEHPLVWTRAVGPVRVLVDALGHDGRSFDSAVHRGLLARGLAWAAGG